MLLAAVAGLSAAAFFAGVATVPNVKFGVPATTNDGSATKEALELPVFASWTTLDNEELSADGAEAIGVTGTGGATDQGCCCQHFGRCNQV